MTHPALKGAALYVLVQAYESDGSDILGVFTTKVKAQEVAQADYDTERADDDDAPTALRWRRDGRTGWYTPEYRQSWYELPEVTVDAFRSQT